jgi:FixJ family two-component response regulator
MRPSDFTRAVSIISTSRSASAESPDTPSRRSNQAFPSAEAFLASDSFDQTRCLILDVAMPGMSGPELQPELMHRQEKIPIVFITAYREESVRRRVFEHGAVAYLFKPFSDTSLLEAIHAALRLNERRSTMNVAGALGLASRASRRGSRSGRYADA